MPPARVVILRCKDYTPERVEASLQRGFELLGGLPVLFRPREALLLKPNLLAPEPPEKCVTTHPSVFQGVARLLQANGAELSYGDSPGFGSPAMVAAKAGLAAVAASLKIPLADFNTGVETPFPEGLQNKQFVLARAAFDHRGRIVNLPKLKTHGLTRFTGAVKNLFGCVPGLLKAEFHVKLPDAHAFARMLVDLDLLLRARIHILDGIQGMEGNGPRSGTPYPLGVLLISQDPVALDATAARLIGMDPEIIPTTAPGLESGLGTWRLKEIELLGDVDQVPTARHFSAVRTPVVATEPKGIWKRLKRWVVPRPFIQAARCTRCGTCVEVCPVRPKAVDWESEADRLAPRAQRQRVPQYDYERCIRCYCCQELCPESAVEIHTPFLGRLIKRK